MLFGKWLFITWFSFLWQLEVMWKDALKGTWFYMGHLSHKLQMEKRCWIFTKHRDTSWKVIYFCACAYTSCFHLSSWCLMSEKKEKKEKKLWVSLMHGTATHTLLESGIVAQLVYLEKWVFLKGWDSKLNPTDIKNLIFYLVWLLMYHLIILYRTHITQFPIYPQLLFLRSC